MKMAIPKALLLQLPPLVSSRPKDWSAFISKTPQQPENKTLDKQAQELCFDNQKNSKILELCFAHHDEKNRRYYRYANYLNQLGSFKDNHPGSSHIRSDFAAQTSLSLAEEPQRSFITKMAADDIPANRSANFTPLFVATGALAGFSLGLHAAFKTRSPCFFVLGSLLGAGTAYLGSRLYDSYKAAQAINALQSYEGLKKTVEDAHEADDAEADRDLIFKIKALQ